MSVIGIVPYEASGAPQGFSSIGVYGVCQIWSTLACFDCISFVRAQNCSLFVLLDSLFAKEVYVKNS